jgi:nucleoside-diphosphate-sugar epimerase
MKEQKAKIIITGSSGLIGAALAERLAASYQVIGFDVKKPPEGSPVDFFKVDITSETSVRDNLEQVRRRHGDRIASVIHLAAYYDFSGEPSPLYDAITVEGTARLLRALKTMQVEQFVFSSTMLVHAPTEPGRPITEDSAIEGKWEYPESKIKTEHLLFENHGDIPLVILRIAGVYDDIGHSIPIAHQIRRIHEKELTSRVYPGDTSRGQSFLHLDDLVEAIWRVIERRRHLPSELTLLIGEPETTSYERLQNTLGELIHGEEEWTTQEIPKPIAKAGAWVQDKTPLGGDPFIKPWMIDLADDHYQIDISRAREYLGWEPQHALLDTLPKIVGVLKQDPVRWYQENKLEVPSDLQKK